MNLTDERCVRCMFEFSNSKLLGGKFRYIDVLAVDGFNMFDIMGIILCNMGLYLHFDSHFFKTWPCPGNSRCETMIYSFPGEHVEKSLQENESFGFNMDHSYGFKVSTFSGPHGFFLSKKPGGV